MIEWAELPFAKLSQKLPGRTYQLCDLRLQRERIHQTPVITLSPYTIGFAVVVRILSTLRRIHQSMRTCVLSYEDFSRRLLLWGGYFFAAVLL